MKTLYESLLDDFEEQDTNWNDNFKKLETKKFLDKNYRFYRGHYTISDKLNKDGKYVVDASIVVFIGVEPSQN